MNLRGILVRLMLRLVIISAGAAAMVAGAQPSQGTAAKTGLKLSDFYAHDPFIVAYKPKKTYYLYTAFGARQSETKHAGVYAYKSKDLKLWEGPEVVFTVPGGIWANPADGAWAPEVHEYKGRFYLFVTLHNQSKLIPETEPTTHPVYQGRPAAPHLRGTQVFVANKPDGPFELLGKEAGPPADFMTLDGTLYQEDGVPYMIYAHEWIQVLDGTMEAVPLSEDLSKAAGKPFYLFKGSDAPWLSEQHEVSNKGRTYVTDGPFLYRTSKGKLLMLWSSYQNGSYMEALAYSSSGKLKGPWRQSPPLVGNDSGHGMLFHSFDGKLMMVLHQPFRQAHAKLFEMKDTGDSIAVKQQLP
jgi:hypothetical protein